MATLEKPLPEVRETRSSIIEDQNTVTETVLAAMQGADNPRLREVMAALVRHLHAFAREVNLTEEEFDLGIDFLNRIGQATNDTHNEGILFSDVLGFSTLVCLLNNGAGGATETASALLGPFWRMNSPRTENGGSIVRCETPDRRCWSMPGSSIRRAGGSKGWRSMSGRLLQSGSTRTRTTPRPI